MMKICSLLLLFSLPLSAQVQSELSGNIETQARRSWNNQMAKDDLFQDWDSENFYLVYGNVNAKLNFNRSHIEANWFVRYSQSNLYDPDPNLLGNDDPYIATKLFTFPNTLVARDLFKLQYKKQNGDHLTESVLNKFYYEWDYHEHRFMVGRMYINYGIGEIFNPINPFNQPTALTSISQVAQGNDGVSFTYFVNDHHSIQLLLLGDKQLDEYEEKIDHTVWASGEYQHSNKLQLNYVLGQDQRRNKIGGQILYNLREANVFLQTFYQSKYNDDTPSEHLWDIMIGFDQQLTSLWHLRLESGHQKQDKHLASNGLGTRFLPTEYFLAVSNIYEIHPLVKLNLTFVNDIKSGFTYLITKATYDLGHNMEAELFGFVPAAKGDSTDNPAQKLVTTDIGVALRAFF